MESRRGTSEIPFSKRDPLKDADASVSLEEKHAP
jgi:hypothetical protein